MRKPGRPKKPSPEASGAGPDRRRKKQRDSASRRRPASLPGLQPEAESLSTILDALKQSEERSRIVATSTNDLIWDWDLSSGSVEWSGRIDQMLGYAQGKFPRTIEAWEKAIHPDDHDRVMAALEGHLAEGAPYAEEYRVVRKDGQFRHWLDRGSAIRDSEGRAYRMFGACTDITERKRAEEALRESEAALKKAQQVSHVGSWAWHIQTNTLDWSDEMYRIFGLDKETFSGDLGEVIHRAIHPDDRAAVEKANRSVIQDKTPMPLEYRVVKPDGTVRTVWAEAGELMLDEAGNPAVLTGIAQDITERKRAEEALREGEEKYRTVVEQSLDGIVIAVGPPAKLVFVNTAFAKMLGYTTDELLAMSPRETYRLVHPDDQEEFFGRFADRLAGKHPPSSYECRGITKDGKTIWVDVSAVLIDFMGTPAVQAVFSDITERRRAEEALRASEEKYRILHEFAGEAIFTYGTDLKMMEINKAACDYLGMAREGLIGRDVFELGILHPDDLGRAVGHIQGLMTGEKPLAVDKLHFKGRHGLYATFQVTSTSVVRDGEIVAITNVCRDVTEEERLYEALEASESRYRFLFNAGNDAVGVYQLREDGSPGCFIEVNEVACQRYGYTRDEFLKLTTRDLAPPEKAPLIPAVVKRLMEEKHVIFEWEHVTKDGRIFPVEISAHLFELNGVTTILSVIRDITERKNAEEHLIASLKEKDILLREIHHRVKNNMQIMSSLLRLQSRQVSDGKAAEAFNESQARIRSMAMIHEKLYQSQDFSSIDFADYVEKMVVHLFAVYKADTRRIEFKLNVKNVILEVNRAIPCGLVLNELISNALKYAFPGEERGQLTVTMFKDEGGKHRLVVKDTGVGIPESIDIRKPQTLGLQIVVDLTKQLDGKLELRRDGGTEFELLF